MLCQTFVHVPGIGDKEERSLWRENILTWEDFLQKDCSTLKQGEMEAVREFLKKSQDKMEAKNHRFFSSHLPAGEHWRAYPDFPASFLDIETTGLSRHRNKITVIGMSDGREDMVFINGRNMGSFSEEIMKRSLFVTFNGLFFDIPFIAAAFPRLRLDQLHIDLRWMLRRLGHTGGLKRIECQLGLSRKDELRGLDGLAAVRLWKRYEKGDDDALRLLIEYNMADVRNLKTLMDYAYESLRNQALRNL